MKGNVICENCGESNAATKKFCGECGSMLPVVDEKKTSDTGVVLTTPRNTKKIITIVSVVLIASSLLGVGVFYIGRQIYRSQHTGTFELNYMTINNGSGEATLNIALRCRDNPLIVTKITMTYTYDSVVHSEILFEGKEKYSIGQQFATTLTTDHVFETMTIFNFNIQQIGVSASGPSFTYFP